MEKIGLSNMVCNGGVGLVIDHELVENRPLDLAKAKAICKQADALGYGLLLMLDDSLDVYKRQVPFKEFFTALKKIGYSEPCTIESFDPS